MGSAVNWRAPPARRLAWKPRSELPRDGRLLVLHCANLVAFGVQEADEAANRGDGRSGHGDFPAVGNHGLGDGVEVAHREGWLEAVEPRSAAWMRSLVHQPLDARVSLVAGVNQVEARRAPRLEF